jgi:hypothetical protein
MIRYRAVQTLTPEVAAQVAGLTDGEGSVTLSRRHSNEHRQLVVSVAHTAAHAVLLLFGLKAASPGIAGTNHPLPFVLQTTPRPANTGPT